MCENFCTISSEKPNSCSDYVLGLGVPFVTLALTYQVNKDACYLGYEWGWLLLGLLWPALWTVTLLVFLMRFLGSREATRVGPDPGLMEVEQAGMDLRLMTKEAGSEKERVAVVKRRWRHGIKMVREREDGEPEFFLGLVREEDYISMRDFLDAIEEDDTFGGRVF